MNETFSEQNGISRKIDKTTGWVLSFGVLMILVFISRVDFVLFHSLVEIFSVIVACGVFMFAWYSRKYLENDFFLVIGFGLLFTGGIDLLHAMYFQGTGVMKFGDPNIATQFWIAARLWQALTFLTAPFFITRKLNTAAAFYLNAIFFALVNLSILYWRNFPTTFIPGAGLTPFKIIAEYIIIAIFIGSIALLYRFREKFDVRVFKLITASIILTILAEFIFTLYSEIGGFYNVLGHLLKVAVFTMVYIAVLDTGLKKPYDLVFRDLQRSREDLKNEKEFEEILLDTVRAVILVLDTEMRIVRFNRYFEEISGYELDEVRGKSWLGLFVPSEDEQTYKNHLEDAINGESFESFTGKLLTRDGKSLSMEWHHQRLRDPGGEFVGLIAVGIDVTERRAAESALFESEERYKLLFNGESDAIIVYKEETGIISEINEAAMDMYGYSRDEFLRLNISGITVSDDDLPDWTRELPLPEFGGKETEFHKTRSGNIFPVEISRGSINLHGEVMTTVLVRDISERVHYQQKILRVNQELASFTHIVSHDLKSPLFLISGYLEVMREDPSEFDSGFEMVQEQVKKMSDFIDRLLDLSRAGKVLGVREEIDLDSMIRQWFSLCVNGDIQAELVIESSLPTITGDPERLEQVFSNLFRNSMEHLEPSRNVLQITVAGNTKPDDRVEIVVSDNGTGIKKEMIEKVFNPGFTLGKQKGTGFGLPISRRIIEAHNGSIQAEYTGEGRGACFRITFPKK